MYCSRAFLAGWVALVLISGNRALRAQIPTGEIIGTVTNGQDAVEAVRLFNPDVLVMDIAMPVLDGIAASERICKIDGRPKILFLTIQESAEYVTAAFAAGASGYVTKRRLLNDLAHAIREVTEGRTFLSPSLHR